MAAAAPASGWLRGKVKAVPSGDTLLIMGNAKTELPPEKTITLASIISPKLARRGTDDESFAWQSREFLRKLCIGKEVTFRVEYSVPTINREFGSVFLGDKNVAYMVVGEGWAKVKEAGSQKAEVSPYIAELRRLEEQAKTQGLGRWTKTPGASGESVRDLPPSAIGDPSNFDAMALLTESKGKPMEAFVEHVRDGSTLRVYLLPKFHFVQVFMAGIQSPSMGRRAALPDVQISSDIVSDEINGEVDATPSLTTAQRLAASTAAASEVPPDPYAREAKHFTEIRVLNRDVRIVLEGVDKFSNLIGSVHYPDGDVAKDLALELIENGLAKFVEWSASMMEEDSKRRLKNAELQAKKDRLRIWTNYVPPPSNSKAIRDDKFTGKVVEVVSGDCIVVADDATPFGSPLAERRVNLSSIRSPKMGRKDEKPAPYAREAKEYLRTRLIGKQVYVTMEYERKVPVTDGPAPPLPSSGMPTDSRIMDFGSVFLVSPSKGEVEDVAPTMSASNQPEGINVAEMVVARGFATVIRHRDFEERSNFYDTLLAAESRASHGKKGIHSAKDPPVVHNQDLSVASAKKTKDFLPFLQRTRRLTAIVDFVLNGHRFKLVIPKETCTIAFSFSGVRCPARGEPYADEAIAFMRRKILQRDVEVEIETVDRVGTYLGSLWESKTNMAVALLEAGLAKLQLSFSVERTVEGHLLAQAEENARKQRLKIWENYVEGQEANGNASDATSKKEVLKVVVTEVLDGGKFYVQVAGDPKVSSIQKQISNLSLQEKLPVVGFNPKKGDVVLAQFSQDGSWNRAMVVNAPRGGGIASSKDEFEVFYIDYGNQETVPYNKMRPLDASVSSAAGLAQLCSLAYIKVPGLEEDFGHEAAEYFNDCTLGSSKELMAMVEERDISGGKVKGKGTGPVLIVTLVDAEAGSSINAAMLQEGLARLERKKRWDTKERQLALDNLEEHQEKAKQGRLNMWQYGDVDSDEEETPTARRGGRR